jgi:hypothetical protein
MGVNDEYSRDAYAGDHYAYNSDGDSDDFDSQIDPEDWQDVYSQELLNAWMTIRMWYEERYLPVRSTYHNFVQFVLCPDPWFTHTLPSPVCTMFWNEISKIRVITDRVSREQFTGWFKDNIENY